MKTLKYKHFKANLTGRDFITGDIHGCFTMLASGLKLLKFKPENDRLFALGDLINRGPDSHKAMEWLDYPWFHSLRGNHEDMFSGSQQSVMPTRAWVRELSAAQQHKLQKKFDSLPYAMGLQTAKGLVGMVHAEVPQNLTWQQFTQGLEADNYEYQHSALWDSERLWHKDNTPISGVFRVFAGHVKQPYAPKKLGNVYYIDTGAYERQMDYSRNMFALTIVSPTASIARLTYAHSPNPRISLRL